jgi:hypothetical protein
VPFAIRWGAGVSSDALRHNLKCSRCGHRGASLSAPSWRDIQVGVRAVPGGVAIDGGSVKGSAHWTELFSIKRRSHFSRQQACRELPS